MSTTYRFPILMLVSLLVLAGILTLVLQARPPARRRLWLVALIVGPGGMLVAKLGATVGAPWWIYYSVPLLLTVALPPLAFRMDRWQAATYWLLALLAAPAIHVAFALTLGWREYMPFLPIP